LAQRNQAGGGTTETPVKMTAPPSSPLAEPQVGTPDGSGIENRKTLSGTSDDELLRAHNPKAAATDNGETNPAEEEETPLAMLPSAPSTILATSPEDKLQLQGKESRSLIITPDTRASKVAPYLGAWKRKIERIGTVNYPNEARRKDMSGSPVLEVTIRADGSLASINVRRSSGHKEIDQAALAILRLAAPFDPFPAALKRDYDELRFAYEWQFMGNAVGGGALRVDNANSGIE
jgi:protein TonB